MTAALAKLTYRHATEVLAGTIGSTSIRYNAASGGFRASQTVGKARFDRESFDPKLKNAAMPKGKYKVAFLGAPYKHYKSGAVLLWPTQSVLSALAGSKRSTKDFLIHGPGPVGSQGCIALYHSAHYVRIMSLFKNAYGKVDWTKPEKERWHGVLQILDDPEEGFKRYKLKSTERPTTMKA